ncbi:efflux pump [Ophiostoma piceae UAMH 11346]|uniref:Efflux pump n=1 Tax=Ophiostoma piceae (strain UAMH 11346) TaxID=1262450 RepID=S3C287_OPHP1|nr:efflux pump [Ophiostoma piceae UAMH 11346]
MDNNETAPTNDRPKVSDSRMADNTEPITGIKLNALLLSLTCASLLVFLDTSVVSTAAPKITDEFHSLSDVGCSVFGPLSGRILHHFSLKWCYVTFFVVFELGSVLCGAAQSSKMLIIGRAIAGVGASGITSSAMTVLSATVPLKKRPATLGILMGIAQLGTICGPIVGGAFTTGYTWRWCFYINLPFAAVVGVPMLLVRIPDQRIKEPVSVILPRLFHYLDLVGFALLAPAIIQLLLALQYGGHQYAWNSSQVIGLFCGSGVTSIVWILWNNYKGDDALIPFSIIRRTRVWASGVNYAFMMATVFGTTYFLPIYFQAVKGVSAIMSGVYFMAIVLPQLLSAVLGGALGDWVGFCIIAGFGRGMALQMPLVAIQAAASPEEMSQAMAFAVWCQYIGPTIFITLYNTIFDTSLQKLLASLEPAVNADLVIAAGATGFRKVVPAEYIPAVIKVFAKSLDRAFYLQAGASVVAFCAAFGMGWQKLQSKTSDSETLPNQPK